MVKIVWTEISVADLKDIFEYIVQDSARYATITVNKMYQRAQMLANNPDLGRIVPEFSDKSIKELIEGNYRIIYRIKNEEEIHILRVYHTSRLLKKNMIR
ncbi:MAG TPA: type II toxin-antitoxin system RelE/ParE family toxin [Bacteroidales bacterium]